MGLIDYFFIWSEGSIASLRRKGPLSAPINAALPQPTPPHCIYTATIGASCKGLREGEKVAFSNFS